MENKKLGIIIISGGILFILGIFVAGLQTTQWTGERINWDRSRIRQQAVDVTPACLYFHRVPVGSSVRVRGEVVQTFPDEYGMMMIGSRRNWRSYDIVVQGDFRGWIIYDGSVATVYGIYAGETTFTTVLGAYRTTPLVTNAWMEV